MEPSSFVKQIMDTNKTVVDNTFKAMAQMQGQAEETLNLFWEPLAIFSTLGQKATASWFQGLKTSREEMKRFAEGAFKQAQSSLG